MNNLFVVSNFLKVNGSNNVLRNTEFYKNILRVDLKVGKKYKNIYFFAYTVDGLNFYLKYNTFKELYPFRRIGFLNLEKNLYYSVIEKDLVDPIRVFWSIYGSSLCFYSYIRLICFYKLYFLVLHRKSLVISEFSNNNLLSVFRIQQSIVWPYLLGQGLFNVKIFWFCLFVCVNINMSSIQIQDFKMITLQESNVALPKYFVPKAFELSSRRAISTNEERFFLFYKKRLKKNI